MSNNKSIAKPIAHHTGHRDRLRQRFMTAGLDGVADYELLELLLFYAIPRRDVKPLAKDLIKNFGSFGDVLTADPLELKKIKGINENTIVLLKASYAASQSLLLEQVQDRPVLGSWQALLDYCHVAMAYEKKEQFRVLFLNRKNDLLADEVQQRGTVDHTPVYPREIIKRALEVGATAVILVHNHPSGDSTPSNADIEMTKEIIRAAEALNVVVHDHIIIAKGGHTSFKTLGLI